MRIKRFNEMQENVFNYDHIIRILKKSHGWGGAGALAQVDDFESNKEYYLNPDNDNDYAEQFHIYLTDMETGQLRGEFNNDTLMRVGGKQIANPISIYNQLT